LVGSFWLLVVRCWKIIIEPFKIQSLPNILIENSIWQTAAQGIERFDTAHRKLYV